MEARRPGDPVALRLHADHLGVGVLGNLPHQVLAVAGGHPVLGLDLFLGVDTRLETGLQLLQFGLCEFSFHARYSVSSQVRYTRSMTRAIPCPTPIHMVHRA